MKDLQQINNIDFNKFITMMFPFYPLSFSQNDLYAALFRIGLYGTGAYIFWRNYRNISYIFTSAAAISLITSIMANIKEKDNV